MATFVVLSSRVVVEYVLQCTLGLMLDCGVLVVVGPPGLGPRIESSVRTGGPSSIVFSQVHPLPPPGPPPLPPNTESMCLGSDFPHVVGVGVWGGQGLVLSVSWAPLWCSVVLACLVVEYVLRCIAGHCVGV